MIVWEDFAPDTDDEPAESGRVRAAVVWLAWLTALGALAVVAAIGLG